MLSPSAHAETFHGARSEAALSSDTGFVNPAVAAGVDALHRRYLRELDTPTSVLAVYTARIGRLNPGLRAFVELDLETAEQAARASEARWAHGRPLSKIDGVPIGVKANIAVRGMPWTAGIGAYRDRLGTADAGCVARLRAAGAIVLGTLNMDEAALGARTDNPVFGRTHNPHRHGHTAGGSSGGAAAAVAAGMCAAALGTDTIGSVRLPAAACGVFGHLPLKSTLSRDGVVPLAPGYDRVGVLARSLADGLLVQRFAAETAGAAPRTVPAMADGPVAALRIPSDLNVDPAVLEAYRLAIDLTREAGFEVRMYDLESTALRASLKQLLLVLEVEGYVEHRQAMAEHQDGFSDELRGLFEWGARQPASRLAAAQRALREWQCALRKRWAGHAAVLTPTAAHTAAAFGGETPRVEAAFTALGSVSGWSAIALPAGMHAGLPLGLQVLAATDSLAARFARRVAPMLPRVPPPQGCLA